MFHVRTKLSDRQEQVVTAGKLETKDTDHQSSDWHNDKMITLHLPAILPVSRII